MSRTRQLRSRIGCVVATVAMCGSLPAVAAVTAAPAAAATPRGAVAVVASLTPSLTSDRYARLTYVDTATGEVLGTADKVTLDGSYVENCAVADRTVIAGGYSVGSQGSMSGFGAEFLPRPGTYMYPWTIRPSVDFVGGIDASPDGRHLLITSGLEGGIADQGVSSVAVDGTRVSEVTVNPAHADLVAKYTDDGTGAVVADRTSVRKLTVDPATGALGLPDQDGTFIPGGVNMLEVDGDLTFVVTNSDSAGGELFVLRTSDLNILSQTRLSDGATSVVVSPDGQTAYVLTRDNAVVAYNVNRAAGTVTEAWWQRISDPDTHRIYARSTLAITPDGRTLYARNGDGAGASVVDTATRSVTALDVGGEVMSVCMSKTLDNRVPNTSITGNHTGDHAAEPGTARRIDLFAFDADHDPLTFAWTVDDADCSFEDSTVEDPQLICPDETATTVRVTVSDGYDTVQVSAAVEFVDEDATAPVIDLTLDGTSGENGWYVSPVNVTWQVTDLESPVTSRSGCDDTTVSEPGAALGCTATSDGGSATRTATVRVDTTDPRVTCPAAPTFSWGASDAAVTATVADDASGPVEGTVTVAADTTSSGARTVEVTGTDVAGRATTVTCGYVVASRYDFIGFASPVEDTMNRAKAGQAIPLKWRLLNRSDGTPAADVTAVKITVTSLPCEGTATADAVEEYAAGTSGLQNLGDGFYQLNWKSPSSYAGSCKSLHLTFDDGSRHTARFWFVR